MAPITHYAKAIVALFSAPLTYIASTFMTGKNPDWRVTVATCITAVLVWAVPNKPPA